MGVLCPDEVAAIRGRAGTIAIVPARPFACVYRGLEFRGVLDGGEELGEPVGGGHDGGAVLASGLAAHALDGARDGQGSQDAARGAAHRGRHGGDAGLALAHGLRPAAPAHLGEHGRVEGGAVQAAVEAVGFLPGQQNLGG